MRKLVVIVAFAACTVGEDGPEPDSEADNDTSGLDGALEAMAGAADAPMADADVTADRDGDGIPDATEEMLLRRYRPYYRFSVSGSSQESYRPANPVDELESAQLKMMKGDGDGTTDVVAGCGRDGDHHLVPAESLFTCAPQSSFLVAQAKTDYCLNLDNTRYHGVSIDEAKANATGFYGHVAPTTIDGHAAYKIEYWQFFAFNNQDISIVGFGSPGDHEGDWTSVQLWFDRELHRLVKIRYLIHGKEATFTIPAVTPACRDCMLQVKGPNYNPKPGNFLADQAQYSDNQAEFYIDDHKYKHVVVYIERGAHEFWPFPYGYAEYAVIGNISFRLNTHNGNGTSYLVPDIKTRVFNMGEVGQPLTRAGKILLTYDGHWGCTNAQQFGPFGSGRKSPIAPAMHCSWRWPDRDPVAACEH